MASKAVNSSYRLHRGSGQAVVTLKGQTYYLGTYGSQESKEKYRRLIAESMVSKTFGMKERQICVAEAINADLEHAERYYNGGSEYKGVYDACDPLARQFASLPIRDFGITQFKVIREHWIKRGCSRQYVNKQMKRLLRVAKWLVAEQINDIFRSCRDTRTPSALVGKVKVNQEKVVRITMLSSNPCTCNSNFWPIKMLLSPRTPVTSPSANFTALSTTNHVPNTKRLLMSQSISAPMVSQLSCLTEVLIRSVRR